MEKEKLTYKDFVEGQIVTCIKNNNKEYGDFYEQHLTVGKSYIVQDVEFRFPDKIAVRSDNDRVTMYMPCEFFGDDLKLIRKKKLEKLKKT